MSNREEGGLLGRPSAGDSGGGDIWRQRADGSGAAERVLDRAAGIWEGFYSPDRKWLVFREGGIDYGSGDIYARLVGTDSVASLVVTTEFQEHSPVLSPNGRWLAYVSNRSDRDEVYVIPFPPDAASDLVTVSANGGSEPVWARGGGELFYRNGANDLVAVQFTEDSTFVRVREDRLFSMDDYLQGQGHASYDVSLDDQQFVMLRIDDEGTGSELIWVQNWAEELRQRLGN